ncbi:hypothetical protein HMPREF9372_1447 [Sporosarcina newyorkensis 2681]|uniref:Uncharacterized protein n=1 Tax=Sporosarcina newyorkensis 2681 TaxID=1027292 RepID=F9DRL7_9BACL|nr:hypothetical protein HMPREF9372_1447 [Sporosarcina newyorkensis 2681]
MKENGIAILEKASLDYLQESSLGIETRDRVTSLNPLRRLRMAPAMSQSGRSPVCLIATPTACEAPAFSERKQQSNPTFRKQFLLLNKYCFFVMCTILIYLSQTSEAATAGSAVAVRQLACSLLVDSWRKAIPQRRSGGNVQTFT